MFYEELQFSEDDRTLMAEENSQKIYAYWIDALKGRSAWTREALQARIEEAMKTMGLKGKKFYFP